MEQCIKRKKVLLLTVMLIAFLVTGQVFFSSPVNANLAESEEFMGYMEDIADDIEEIHEDMHVVAYNLRLLAYSNIAIGALLLIGLIGLMKKK